MADESLYKATNKRLQILENRGFDYRGRLLLRSTDPNLYKNAKILGFAKLLESIIGSWFRTAKQIKCFINYTVDYDSDEIN